MRTKVIKVISELSLKYDEILPGLGEWRGSVPHLRVLLAQHTTFTVLLATTVLAT